jgi:hypothetical protein
LQQQYTKPFLFIYNFRDLQFSGTDDIKESEDIADTGEAHVGCSNSLLNAEDDSLGSVGLAYAVNHGIQETECTVSAFTLYKNQKNLYKY